MKAIAILFTVLLATACHQPKKVDKPVAKQPKQEVQKLEYWTYGLPNPAYKPNAEAVLSRKWGFVTKSVAGCVVTPGLLDSVALHNKAVDKSLLAKYGKNWNDRYTKELAAEVVRQKKVADILDRDPDLNIKRNQIEKEDGALNYYMWPSTNQEMYEVTVTGWKMVKEESVNILYGTYEVDLNNSSTSLKSGKVTKL